MALTNEQEELLLQVAAAVQNGKRIVDLPDVGDANVFDLITEVIDNTGESKKANFAAIFPSPKELYAYGVEWDTLVSSPLCTRIGNLAMHVSLPIQSRMRRCLLRDNGTVNYYLHPTDSTLKDTGAPAVLDGTDGQVMVEIPEHYRKFETEGTKQRCLISEYHLPNFHFVPKAYRSAYEAAVDRTNTAAPKLCSVSNGAAAFRGGNNNAAWDGTYRSLLRRPATNINLTNFRAYARNRGVAGKNGAGWNCDVYEIQKTCYWLYIVEYANLNCQADYNAAPTSEGYRQGGLGKGVTLSDSVKWDNFNVYSGFIPCGHTNSLGNRTGFVNFTMPAEYGETLTLQVPSYRGMENLYGHLFLLIDGCKCRISADVANGGTGLSELFVCGEPANFQDVSYDGYKNIGQISRRSSYIKELLFGEFGENVANLIGGSSSTYMSDVYKISIPSSGEDIINIIIGGSFFNKDEAGLSSVGISYSYLDTRSNIGTRLCFIPA
jgi:hypothetical protein